MRKSPLFVLVTFLWNHKYYFIITIFIFKEVGDQNLVQSTFTQKSVSVVERKVQSYINAFSGFSGSFFSGRRGERTFLDLLLEFLLNAGNVRNLELRDECWKKIIRLE